MAKIKKILVTEEEIVSICKNLGQQITKDYQNKNLVIVCILKGAVPFMAELIKRIDLNLTTEFMQISSYKGNTSYSGEIKVIKDIDGSIKNKDILIVEDIIDSGRTLKKIIELIKVREPSSINICSLLIKEQALEEKSNIKYYGKIVGNEFVVGFGLDFQEIYRNIPYIGILEE